MGKFSRDKGAREERAFVDFWKAYGAECKRVPLSGATDFHKGDVVLHGYQGEVKVRGSGYRTIYSQLGDNDFLAIRQNQCARLYVLPEETMVKLMRAAGLCGPVSPEAAVRGGE